MLKRRLALTVLPVINTRRGDKAACMNDVTLHRTITLAGLMERWANKRIVDYDLDFVGIRELVRQGNQLPAYILIRQLEITGGNRICRASQISYADMMRELRERQGFYAVIFNLDDVEKFELDNFNTKNSDGIEDKISMWRMALSSFTEGEKEIAQVVIGKFQGKSHTDIGREVYGENISDMNSKIRRLKIQAQGLADKYKLPMPEWSSRKK